MTLPVWHYPEVFGDAICMSSTFSHKDDLLERVLSEPKREVGFYLDSGWPALSRASRSSNRDINANPG